MDSKVELVCTLWVHDATFSTDDVVFNQGLLPQGDSSRDRLLRVAPHRGLTASRDFAAGASQFNQHHDSSTLASAGVARKETSQKPAQSAKVISQVTARDCYLFAARDMSTEQKLRYPNLQVRLLFRDDLLLLKS